MWVQLRESSKELQSTPRLATARHYYLPKLNMLMRGTLLEMKQRERGKKRWEGRGKGGANLPQVDTQCLAKEERKEYSFLLLPSHYLGYWWFLPLAEQIWKREDKKSIDRILKVAGYRVWWTSHITM